MNITNSFRILHSIYLLTSHSYILSTPFLSSNPIIYSLYMQKIQLICLPECHTATGPSTQFKTFTLWVMHINWTSCTNIFCGIKLFLHCLSLTKSAHLSLPLVFFVFATMTRTCRTVCRRIPKLLSCCSSTPVSLEIIFSLKINSLDTPVFIVWCFIVLDY